MKYIDYREDKQQGTFDFPIDYYHVESSHPRYQMPYHWHPECEIIRILEGSFQFTIDGKTITAASDDILFLPGGTLHGGNPYDCVYECIVFDLKLLLGNNKLCRKQINQLMRGELIVDLNLSAHKDVLKNSVNVLFRAMSEKQPGYEFLTQGSLFMLLGLVFEKQYYSINNAPTNTSALQLNRFKDVLQYIEEHYTEALTLEQMANVAGLSPRYFCRFFRKMTRYTPTEYLNYYRIECACEQLSETNLAITEVALNCGFNDISYFIKVFHKAKSITPRQYKNLSQKSTKDA